MLACDSFVRTGVCKQREDVRVCRRRVKGWREAGLWVGPGGRERGGGGSKHLHEKAHRKDQLEAVDQGAEGWRVIWDSRASRSPSLQYFPLLNACSDSIAFGWNEILLNWVTSLCRHFRPIASAAFTLCSVHISSVQVVSSLFASARKGDSTMSAF